MLPDSVDGIRDLRALIEDIEARLKQPMGMHDSVVGPLFGYVAPRTLLIWVSGAPERFDLWSKSDLQGWYRICQVHPYAWNTPQQAHDYFVKTFVEAYMEMAPAPLVSAHRP